MRSNCKLLLSIGLLLAFPGSSLLAQTAEEETVEASSLVLREIMAIPARCIPETLLREAEGVAIFPGLVKGGFIVGVKHGRGVVLVRDVSGAWRTPVFISATGGSIGFQAGLQETDVVLVFRNRKGVEGLMRGKFTIGADAAVAAGPVGRQATLATDAQLRAEILSYSRSRGLFAGVSIDGAMIQMDRRSSLSFYGAAPGQLPRLIPASAIRLVEQVAAYAGQPGRVVINAREPLPVGPPVLVNPGPPVGGPNPVSEVAPPVSAAPVGDDQVQQLRKQLVAAFGRLQTVLDPQWQRYLALPPEIYPEGPPASPHFLEKCLTHYQATAGDPRYQALTVRPEFREVMTLLMRYREALPVPAGAVLRLPPPPPG
jgi:lipid-binding SYLF domain-containing protein